MEPIFSSDVVGRHMIGTDGREFGTIESVTIDPDEGRLVALLVEPQSSTISVFDTTDMGLLEAPTTTVQALDQHIVVEPDGTI